MKVVYKSNLDPNRQAYECYVCGELFNWCKESVWYGSDKQMEEKPDKIKYFCSNKCISDWRNNKINGKS